jgi:hypothetical protein
MGRPILWCQFSGHVICCEGWYVAQWGYGIGTIWAVHDEILSEPSGGLNAQDWM